MVHQDVLFRFLSQSKTKLKIIRILDENPNYVRELSEKLQIFPSAVLKHLIFLEKKGLVKNETIANKKYYVLTPLGKKMLEAF